jgi:hypothetical protein
LCLRRLVGYRLVPPEDLLANPLNARRHPNTQREALRASLRSLGWIAPVLQSVRSGALLDGHLRIEEALSAGVPQVPVVDVDLTPEQEALALAAYDPIGAMASYDRESLDHLLREIDTGEAALQTLLDSLAAQAGLVPPVDPMAEWAGMPEYEHEDQAAFQSLTLNFKDQDAVAAFAALVGQKITPHTRFIWYPEIEIERYADKRYAPES